MDLSEQDALVARLKEEVERKKAEFEAAKREHYLAVERMKELSPGHPDGFVDHATIAYTRALLTYRAALHRFNRLILDGELPPTAKFGN